MEQKQTKRCRYCKTEIPKDAKVCPQCRKRQGGRLRWVVAVVFVLVVVAIGAGGREEDKAPVSVSASAQQESEPTPAAGDAAPTPVAAVPTEAPQPTPVPTPAVTRYESGMYLVGQDMPAGEYVIFTDGFSGYMEVTSDSSGNFDSILCNANFAYNTIVTVSEGQYLSFLSSHAVPIEQAQLDTSGEGMFKVGLHLPAGEYHIVLDDDNGIGFGYVEVASDSSHALSSIRTNDNIQGASYITVNEGEYLTLTGCHIES